jgi:GNAT superfamily N-acetyltransferase
MILRAATPDDAPGMARVLGDWVRETGWMPVLHTRVEDELFCRSLIMGQVVTVVDDGGVAGFMARDGEDVTCLYLAPRVRRRGFGGQLIDLAKTASDRLALWTFQANLGAMRFYVGHGFVETERTDGSANDERLPDVRLVWQRGPDG